VQTGGQVEHGIPTGIPTKNQKTSLSYKSTNYKIDSNPPGPPTINNKARPVRALSHLQFRIRTINQPTS
jgi:hypothetical protein